MKLLLDTHHSRFAAERLRAMGWDVAAAADDPMLASLPDEELLRTSTSEGRTLVTEDVADFGRIARDWAANGQAHGGLVFTSPRGFHRGSRAYPSNLVAALDALLKTSISENEGWVHWLQHDES